MRFAALSLVLAVLLPGASAQMHLPAGDAWYDMANAAIFREGEMATIHVQMSPSHLNEMLANPWNEVEYPCSMRFTNSVIDETVPDIRIKIRGNTSRNSIKKSFKLSFNSVVPGTRFYGLKKINIIGDQNDVSVVRAKVSLDALRAFGLPAQRALLTHFIINDGARVNDVYVSTEQMNDDFVEAWFGTNTGNLYKCGYQGARADLRYVSPGTPSTYRNLGGGETYKEEINEDNPNYQDLADFIYFINKSSDEQFRAELPKWLNVEGFLRNMAADVVVGQWDGIWFGANNYYLYHNPETGRFEYLPYDYDNTIGIDFFNIDWAKRGLENWAAGGFGWNPDAPPLPRRVMQNPAWNRQFRRYVREMVGAPVRPPVGPVIADTAGDVFLASTDPHFDILSAEVSNDYGFLYVTVKVAGPIDVGGSTDQARIMLFFNTREGGNTGNPWGRDINNTVASDYLICAWTNGGGGWISYRIVGASTWSEHYRSTGTTGGISMDLSRKAEGIVQFAIPRAIMSLQFGQTIAFDVVTTNDRGADIEPGLDHLSNPAMATPDYNTPSTPGTFPSYTLQAFAPAVPGAVFTSANLAPKNNLLRALALPYAYKGPMSGSTMDWGWTNDEFSRSFDYPTSYNGLRLPWVWGINPYIATRAAWITANVGAPSPLPRVFVNEVLPLNGSTNRDEAGEYDDWIELFNAERYPVDVGGMYLTDDPTQTRKWKIPAGTVIPAGGFLLIWADGQPEQGPLHAGFRLSADGENVALYDRDEAGNLLVDCLSYPALMTDQSHGRYADGTTATMSFTTVTPQAPNDPTARTIVTRPVPKVVINEFMASNSKTVRDEYGEADDWVEIYNAGLEAVDLGGRHLTDSLSNRTKFEFPAGTVIPSGGRLILWLDDQPAQGPRHLPFKLSATGEQIGLFDTSDNNLLPIDTLTFGVQTTDVSMGRPCDGRPGLVTQPRPTPGLANAGTGCTPICPTVTENPRSATVMIGGSVTLSLAAEGTVPMYIRWRRNGQPLADGERVAGSGTPRLTLTGLQPAESGLYDATLWNDCGTQVVTDAAVVNVEPWTVEQSLAVLRAAAGIETPLPETRARLDLNADGVLDILDAFLAARLAAG